MLEEYGTLSEEELIEEIKKELEGNPVIDASDLEFKFEDDRLTITGSLQTEEELETLINMLEDYIDPKEYDCEIEVIEAGGEKFSKRAGFKNVEDSDEEEDEEEDLLDEDGMEEVEEDDQDFEEEDEEGGFDDEKW